MYIYKNNFLCCFFLSVYLMTTTTLEKRIYLENSPLARSTIILLDQLKNIASSLPSSQQNNLLSSSSPSSPSPIVIQPTQISINNISKIDEKIKIDFPLDIGRKLLSDTVDNSYFWSFKHDQTYINNNIKTAIIESSINLRKLIKDYGISICDLKNFRIVTDLDSLKKLDFRGLDLSIDRTLFNTSHLKNLFNLNYIDLIKKRIKFNLFVLVKGRFNFNELQTITFDFDICINQTAILNKGFNEQEKIEFKKQMKQQFQEIYTSRPPQLSYSEMVSLNLKDSHLNYLGIKVSDIKRYVI